ncbi:hypothetical protein RUM8411_03220 [Ruegeria meonggei]|uniref:Uncharacterized protein n=1 Tax=Ruegeria meonggei TaxID=1446476 RepID=A0A1X7A084_9RHOB|nr:hypothetical protein RUM8411_03220 [Ruegeria meonggei]
MVYYKADASSPKPTFVLSRGDSLEEKMLSWRH